MVRFFLFALCFLCAKGNAFTFTDIQNEPHIYLYAGDLLPYLRNSHQAYEKFVGLSLHTNDGVHIRWDVTKKFPLPDNCVDIFQSEDVFEHIEYAKLKETINEIYRVLKPGGFFRLSIPDYRCDILVERSLKDSRGQILFDPVGGGRLVKGKVIGGGHAWFPTIELVENLLNQTLFAEYGKIEYLHYYTTNGEPITNPIDYTLAHVQRTPDHDGRVSNPYRPMSIVVDLYKQ